MGKDIGYSRTKRDTGEEKLERQNFLTPYNTIRYDTIGEFNVDSKAEYSALSCTRSQKKKLKQRQYPFNTVAYTLRSVKSVRKEM